MFTSWVPGAMDAGAAITAGRRTVTSGKISAELR